MFDAVGWWAAVWQNPSPHRRCPTLQRNNNSNDVVIRDVGVSKRHFGIKIEDMRYELADFGSTNGVLINDRPAQKQFLKAGDTIRVGGTEMTFHLK